MLNAAVGKDLKPDDDEFVRLQSYSIENVVHALPNRLDNGFIVGVNF